MAPQTLKTGEYFTKMARQVTGHAFFDQAAPQLRTDKSHMDLNFEGAKQTEKSPWAKRGNTFSHHGYQGSP